jgi:hypothetical protein
MPFQMKPLELTDFSGGMSDNFLTAGPTHYYQADNFWITVDKNLQERFGTNILDANAFNIPGANRRVAGLYTFVNESILLAQSARNIYVYNKNQNFSSIVGPSGNEPLNAGDIYSSVVSAEWNRHMYFTSDAQPNPVKIYRDHNNVFQARTAGLPRTINAQANLTPTQVLSNAIVLANAVRASMINHIQDLTLHSTLDKVALNYFVAQSFNPGEEQPPAGVVSLGAATDQTTLFALLANISAAYEHQRADASNNGTRVYHTNLYSFASNFTQPITPTGMHVRLVNGTAPISLALAAAQVDDIAQKWYWHRLAIWTHSPTNSYTDMNAYSISVSKVGLINTGQAVATGNLKDAFNFIGNVKSYFNQHIASGGLVGASHKFPDNTIESQDASLGLPNLPTQTWNCNLPDPFDYDSFGNLIFHLRCLYFLHYSDAATVSAFQTVLFDSTSLNNTLLNVNLANPFTANISPNKQFLYAPTVLFRADFIGSPFITSTYMWSAFAGTANCADFAQATLTQAKGQISFSQYHIAADSQGNLLDVFPPSVGTYAPPSTTAIASQIDLVGTDAKSWLALGSELFSALAQHMADGTTHATARSLISKPALYTTPYAPFFVPTIASYSYAFIFSQTYQVEPNGLTYLVQSNPVFIGPILSSSIIPPSAVVLSQNTLLYPSITYQNTVPIALSNIPSIVNTSGTNYDLTSVVPANPLVPNNLTVDIYRTTDGGITYYKVTSITNGTTTYSDQTSDSVSFSGFAALNTNQTLYTTGGVVGNDQPPQSVCNTALNGYMYYGGIIDTGQNFPNRVRQSLPNNADSAPAQFFDDLEDAIVGMSSSRSIVVALCQRSLYRLTGNFNSLGQGLITHEKISDSMGCISAKSIVKTEIGIFFAGIDGFYYTDGYQLIKISIELNQRYQAFTATANQQKRIVGSYDRLTRRIWWTMQTNPTDTNPDSFFIFYLDYGVKPSGVFTTASNFNWMRPASCVFFNGQLVYGHEEGYLFKTDPNCKTDPKVDITTAPSLWNDVYLPYYFASTSLDFGSLFTRKWTTKIHYTANNTGNVAIQFVSIRDNRGDIPGNLPIVNYTYNPMWGQPNIVWNKPSAQQLYNWEYDQKIDVWRRFPAGNLRCDTKQIIMQPAFLAVYRSQDWPPFCFANTNGGTKAVTIATPAGFSSIVWPLDIVDMQFSFSNDGYVKTYPVISVAGNSAIVSDPNSTLTTLTLQNWVIRGYKKGQRAYINSIIIYYDFLGDKNDAYLGKGSAGENV